MDWQLIFEPGVLVGVIAAATVLLLILPLLVRRFSRRESRAPESAEDRAAAVLEAYRESHPAFYRIMASFQEVHDLDELLIKGDVKAAFRLLETKMKQKGTRLRAKAKGSSLSITRQTYRDESRVNAAILTVLRALYVDESLCSSLSPSADRELDELLDSLA